MEGICTYTLRNEKSTNTVLAGKSERKGQLGGPKRRWKDNVELNLKANKVERVNGILFTEVRAGGRAGISWLAETISACH